MLAVIALVGRPNVGKSTLFNLLTRSRDALVADFPGLTRDRKYGFGKLGPGPYVVIDTGGLTGDADGIQGLMARQTLVALDEADLVFFMVDGREGLTALDMQIAELLRPLGKRLRLLVNKVEGQDPDMAGAEFHALAMGDPVCISSSHGHNIPALMDAVFEELPETEAPEPEEQGQAIRIAVIGRPNVGKSTLINRLLGEERQLAFDQPGTTRDSVYIPFERDERKYVLIDTAGVRRKARVHEIIEKFSIVKTLQAIDAAHVVIAVLDAREAITDQDASLLGLTVERGRALAIAVNKWDGLSPDQRDTIKRQIDVKLPFLEFAPMHFISALHGSGLGELFMSVNRAYTASMRDIATPDLTRALEDAVMAHQPPLVKGKRIKLRYAHQGGRNPPVIVIHGNRTKSVPASYRRYLINYFRKRYAMFGTPVRIEFKSGDNPYEGKRNKLTPRQQRKRERLKKFIKRSK